MMSVVHVTNIVSCWVERETFYPGLQREEGRRRESESDSKREREREK